MHFRRTRFAWLSIVGVLMTFAPTAFAGLIPSDQARLVSHEYEVWDECCWPDPIAYSTIYETVYTNDELGEWNADAFGSESSAIQTSDLRSSGIVATGMAEQSYMSLRATSSLKVTFETDQVSDYALSATLASATLTLRRLTLDEVPVWVNMVSLSGDFEIDRIIRLLPGRTYELEAIATTYIPGHGGGTVFSESSFDVQFVPEPGTALLVGAGLCLLARARRRVGAA